MDVLNTALKAESLGYSVLPIPANGEKYPGDYWKEFQKRRATTAELKRWFAAAPDAGLCIICGKVSGNLEMLDFDDREIYELFKGAAQDVGLGELVERIEAGYLEHSPKGVHWFWKCETIEGNLKLARRLAFDAGGNPIMETSEDGKQIQKIEVLIETRGEGGLGVIAPSAGKVHPDGLPYVLVRGSLATIPTITPKERAELFYLAKCFDEMPQKEEKAAKEAQTKAQSGFKVRPGDDYMARTEWREILAPNGWVELRSYGTKTYWRRPGKNKGVSATTGHAGTDYLYVFSSSTVFATERAYNKFSAFALLEHDGDFTAAAKELARKGYGTPADQARPAPKVDPETGEILEEETTAETKKEKAPSQATLMLGLTEDLELFHTADRRAFGTVEINDHKENWPIRSKDFKLILKGRYYEKYKTAPGSQATEDALSVLEAKALYSSPEKEVFLRLADHEGAIYLDLTNDKWQVVEITSKGWKVINNPPVKFIRSSGMLPMVNPETGRGGRLDELLDFINCESDDWKLLAAWIVASFNPAIPYPVCTMNGEQGSGKSDACTMLRMLLDPSKTPLRATPKDERDFWIGSQNSRIVAYDNLSGIQPWLSDALCRLATGGGSTTRLLYSDDEEVFFTARRPVLLNGIDAVATRSDLLERSIIINLPVIDQEKRRPHRKLFEDFEAKLPRILAGALDAVSTALARQNAVNLKELPRMADFTLWAVAAEPAFGGSKEVTFLTEYLQQQSQSNDLALESSVLGKIFPKWAEGFELTGYLAPSNDMLKDIENSIPDDDERRKVTNQKTWPKSGRAFSNALRRIAPSLRANGIKLTFDVYENNVKRGIRVEFIEVKDKTE